MPLPQSSHTGSGHSPPALVHSEECCSLVLRVVGNDHAHKQCEANHAAQEDKDVNVDGGRLWGMNICEADTS